EPFDFILYASVSALGFAFVENVMYLYRSDLTAVYARALYSSVAHMFFSSIIAYGFIWWEYRGHKFNLGTFLVLLLLASLGHGFYDFWLIRFDLKLQLITLLFFLLSLHFWVMMKNNLINISGFYTPLLKLRSHLFMYRLVSIVLIVAMVGYNILFGKAATRSFGWHVLSQYGYVFVYVTVSFSSFQVIPGYIRSLELPRNIFTLLLPRIIRHPDYTGRQVQMDKRGRRAAGSEPVLNYLGGTQRELQHRVVIDGLPNCYGIEVGGNVYILQFIKAHPRQDDVWQVMIYKPKDETLQHRSFFKNMELARQGEMLVRILK
ncbi:MAG: PrsW family glutamic-type intramembrane protease, partial [Owenweeksia sp.]